MTLHFDLVDHNRDACDFSCSGQQIPKEANIAASESISPFVHVLRRACSPAFHLLTRTASAPSIAGQKQLRKRWRTVISSVPPLTETKAGVILSGSSPDNSTTFSVRQHFSFRTASNTRRTPLPRVREGLQSRTPIPALRECVSGGVPRSRRPYSFQPFAAHVAALVNDLSLRNPVGEADGHSHWDHKRAA